MPRGGNTKQQRKRVWGGRGGRVTSEQRPGCIHASSQLRTARPDPVQAVTHSVVNAVARAPAQDPPHSPPRPRMLAPRRHSGMSARPRQCLRPGAPSFPPASTPRARSSQPLHPCFSPPESLLLLTPSAAPGLGPVPPGSVPDVLVLRAAVQGSRTPTPLAWPALPQELLEFGTACYPSAWLRPWHTVDTQ